MVINMEKLRMNEKVEEVIIIVVFILALVGLLMFDSWYTNKAVVQCINAGQKESICEELRN